MRLGALERNGSEDDLSIHEASAVDLDGWDRMAVDRPGGHVFQSLAWAEECRRLGWQTRFLQFQDGFAALSVERTWPLIGGRSAYLPRGPIPAGEPAATTAARLQAIVEFLGRQGVDVVASDAEVPAATGYPALLARAGFHEIPEIQPSRHRLTLPLEPGRGEEAVFAGVARQTRQRIRAAERSDITVVLHDSLASADSGEEFRLPDDDPAATDRALATFYSMLEATGERRHFHFGPREDYVRWWRSALAAGHLVLLEAKLGEATIAGLVLYRHGGRLSTVHSGDRAELRREHPGTLHLLRWRAIQLAIREGCGELDFGGVDVAGARREPAEGEPMYGLYQHKRSFGASWLELSGAHERVIRPARYRLGRLTGRLARLASGREPAGPTNEGASPADGR